MPAKPDAKTVSGLKNTERYLFGFAAVGMIVLASGVALWAVFSGNRTGGNYARCAFSVPTAVGGSRFRPVAKECVWLEIADTQEERIQGLSGRNKLLPYYGMLFVFDETSRQCMWMKDMNFSLDIIWLDEDRRINKIEENVSPETFPQSFCSNDTKYVIEVNPGTADQAQLKLGQKLPL